MGQIKAKNIVSHCMTWALRQLSSIRHAVAIEAGHAFWAVSYRVRLLWIGPRKLEEAMNKAQMAADGLQILLDPDPLPHYVEGIGDRDQLLKAAMKDLEDATDLLRDVLDPYDEESRCTPR